MSKRKNTRPERRFEKIQQDRLSRNAKRRVLADEMEMSSQLGPRQNGQIIAHYGANLDVEDELGQIHHCLTRRNLPKLVCGDFVVWQAADKQAGIIVELKPRTTLLTRPNYNEQPKPVAANIDQIMVVSAPSPNYDEDLINRYLVAAQLTEITPVIVFNKIDILSDKQLDQIKQEFQIYNELGYRIIYASTKQRHGLDALLQQVQECTSIFVGQSGVGKSSLIKALIPDSGARVGELSKATGLGKHTTTVTLLYRLDHTGSIIDSPGVREFGLGHVTQHQIAMGFREFQVFLGQCKFNDCTHFSEPDCAIRQAVETGDISQRRFESYHRLVNSLSRT